MNQISEQFSMFELAAVTAGLEIVLVEVSPTRKPKQSTVGPKQEGPNARIAKLIIIDKE